MKRIITDILAWFGNKRAIQIRLCRLVRMCFNDVDFAVHTFTCNGSSMLENKNGEKYFYSVKEIDKAIKKVNNVLTKLG